MALFTATTITGLSTTPGDWFLINVKQMSFYRIDYDRTLRQEIALQLNINHQVSKLHWSRTDRSLRENLDASRANVR
jgi:hypothetical protein